MRVQVPLFPAWTRWLAVIGLAGFIFYASIITVPPETVIDEFRFDLLPLDKWRHLVAYAVLGAALAYATTDWDLETKYLALLVIGITVVYGVGIEFGQSMIPQRYFSLGDAYANALGAILITPYYYLRSYLTFVPLRTYLESLKQSL